MSYIIDGDKLLRELSKERLIYPYNVIAEERVKEKLRSIIYSLPEESNEEMEEDDEETIHCKDCEYWSPREKSLQGRCELRGMYPTGTWFCGNARKKEE